MWMSNGTIRILLIVTCLRNPFGNIGRIGTACYLQCTCIGSLADRRLSVSACESTSVEISDCRLFVTAIVIVSLESLKTNEKNNLEK